MNEPLSKHDGMQIIRNQELILKLLLPKEFTIAKIVEITGRSRQAVKLWLENNAEPDVGFFKKDGKIFVSEEVALKYINERR